MVFLSGLEDIEVSRLMVSPLHSLVRSAHESISPTHSVGIDNLLIVRIHRSALNIGIVSLLYALVDDFQILSSASIRILLYMIAL